MRDMSGRPSDKVIVSCFLYQYEPGIWKAINAMKINWAKGNGEIEPHFVESMQIRRLMLRQRVDSSDNITQSKPLGRIYRATYDNWLQTIDIVQVTNVERVQPSVPTTWEERAASLHVAGASFEGGDHTKCDYCRINMITDCRWYTQHNVARCQNCLDVGIPCTFSSATMITSGGAVVNLLARASTKYGKPEVRDFNDPETEYMAVRDLLY